jgi:hypothetical protein
LRITFEHAVHSAMPPRQEASMAKWILTQNLVNTDFVRFITKVDRDRLILRATPLLKGGERVTQELVWERMKPTR